MISTLAVVQSDLGPGFTIGLLISLLVFKELARSALRHKWRRLSDALTFVLAPLVIIFFFNIAIELYDLITP